MSSNGETTAGGGSEDQGTNTDTAINAHPTKDFFIFMLVKDIGLLRAIIDLIDNSVDGAKRLRPNGDFSGLHVSLNVAGDSLSIEDNCGGIPVEVARKYAFRFGRPHDMPDTIRSVGQFGVGMKRSIFKLGRQAHIESTSTDGGFVVDINVDEWLVDPDNWNFEFSQLTPSTGGQEATEFGTLVRVDLLHDSVSKDFALENFQSRLKSEIEQAHQNSIERGLVIRVNGIPLRSIPSQLLHSEELQPAHKQLEFGADGDKVVVDIYCGIAEGNPSVAGWTIYCNNRMVVNADQTETSGWGEGQGKTIPKYHNTFARFRGYVYFDSAVTRHLPWNTTKTGVDIDSDFYQSVRLEMITLMRPVLDFLNQLASERTEDAGDPGPLESSVLDAKPARVESIQKSVPFTAPKRVPRQEPDMGRIQYSKPLSEIYAIQGALGVNTYKEVGEKTFEYFLRMECD